MAASPQRLKRRKDFLAAARGRSFAASGAVVQVRRREDEGAPRAGFTVTKKLGGAVVRNRIRRRLKEAVRLALARRLKPGRDYVFIGRAQGLKRPFEALQADLRKAIGKLEQEPASAARDA
jgi:ribonuclease P protein component